MDVNDMQDKMAPPHRDILRRMLGVNELPEFLLKRYYAVKGLLDRVDGFLSPCDLLRIAMDCGLNLETKKFNNGDQNTFTTSDGAKISFSASSKNIDEEAAVNVELKPEPDKPATDKDKQLNALKEKVAAKEAVELEPEIEDEVHEEEMETDTENIPIADGTVVKVFYEGETEKGIILSSSKLENGESYYEVKLDNGETESFEEYDIQV